MIDGFKVTMTGQELQTHFMGRSKYHWERADWYDQQKEQFALAPTADMSNDPVKGLKEAGKRHRERSLLFEFYAKHVELDEKYRIVRHEMGELELI